MAYISAIAVDFGSTNSGCARITSFDQDGKLMYDTPHLVHSTGTYAKDNSWFYIEPSFHERVISHYDELKDSDFRIESRIVHDTNPNIIWGRSSIKQYADKLDSEHWVSYRNFKMLLRDGLPDTMLNFPLTTIIKTFLRVLKIECLSIESERLGRPVSADEIQWGVTIPAIWDDENKRIMSECAHSVFTQSTRILSEPEGPLVAHLLMTSGNGKVEYRDGRTSLVIDMGGGTTDICLMKEVRQNDGSFRLEMVTNTDGSAAGGNDVDRDFYLFMLRHISKGKTSDAGVAYDSMNDETLIRQTFDGFRADISSFMDFEDNWMNLKGQVYLGSRPTCDFVFTREFRKWLAENGHTQLADVVKEMLIDGCSFQTDQFMQKVLVPTFTRVCDKVKEIIIANKDSVNFDSIILAGGMSQNYSLNVMVKRTICDLLGSKGESAIKEAPGLFAGSSIMTGTCFLLVNRSFVMRLARRNYYYDCNAVSGVTNCLYSDYAALGENYKIGDIESLREDEERQGYAGEDSSSILVLRPVEIKGKIIRPYHVKVHSKEGQTRANILFYSSDGGIIIFANQSNPLLTVEGEIEVDCKENATYDLEVDFNEAAISNELHYILKDEETGEILGDAFIGNCSYDEI